MAEYSLIANTGIHITTFPLELRTQDRFNTLFHEWVDSSTKDRMLDLVMEVPSEDHCRYYEKKAVMDGGFLAGGKTGRNIDYKDLEQSGIRPLKIDDDMCADGEIYKMNFTDRNSFFDKFVNKWLPIPYFLKRGENRFNPGPLNWSRFMLVPDEKSMNGSDGGVKRYQVMLAFDTRTGTSSNKYGECPVFPDDFTKEMIFEVCRNEAMLMDFCNDDERWEYIDKYIFSLAHPGLGSIDQVDSKQRKFAYRASYFHLIDYIAQTIKRDNDREEHLFPTVKLFRSGNVEAIDVDMVVDIGNSRTTALLLDGSDFTKVKSLELVNYSRLLKEGEINRCKDPFDMRVAFRKVDFGSFGIRDSKQFVHSSFVRLGKEADYLIHKATENDVGKERLSTMSSPKRYLWDARPSKDEWKFVVLDGEKDSSVLNISGLSKYLESDGRVSEMGNGGQSYHYSRRSIMTLAFLEMLTQAQTQINSYEYRKVIGDLDTPRRIRRLVVTCPTAMSKVEREALVNCAKDAAKLLSLFKGSECNIDVVPKMPNLRDEENKWYYDEATCSQLVYIYSEVGCKYKGSCQEFFKLYGKPDSSAENAPHKLTVGSLDIGAGTSDLMIARYSYTKGDITTITPDPLFYDSFYYAGDDMLHELVKNILFLAENSAFRKMMPDVSGKAYLQKMMDFIGPDYNELSYAGRLLRRDFNLQYSVPLMYHFLEKLSKDCSDEIVSYRDVFKDEDSEPNTRIKEGFKEYFGFELESLQWEFKKEILSSCITKAFEPLLKQIATIMFTYSCDIILLSGRPASLTPIRNIFLKYYPVSPNRLILLNDFYVGSWYPFTKNTGFIKRDPFGPKTVVAVGALLGYYAADFHILPKFVINTEKLDTGLKSVVNFVESSRDELPVRFFLEKDSRSGNLLVNNLPLTLDVRQLKLDSYPSRKLYVIDFNKYKIADRLRHRDDFAQMNESEIFDKTKSVIDVLRTRLPFHLTIERDDMDREKLNITSITDKNGDDLSDNNVEINIQSLGADDFYWLDTGAFEIR